MKVYGQSIGYVCWSIRQIWCRIKKLCIQQQERSQTKKSKSMQFNAIHIPYHKFIVQYTAHQIERSVIKNHLSFVFLSHVSTPTRLSSWRYIQRRTTKEKYVKDVQVSYKQYRELTLILRTWRIWWAPNYASKWQMGFNSVFKGLNLLKFTYIVVNKRKSFCCQQNFRLCLNVLTLWRLTTTIVVVPHR